MAANTSPIFILTPNIGTTRLVAATTASDGSGTMYPLVTAGVNGTRVDAVRFRNSQVALAASSAMVHRIFYSATNQSGSATSSIVKMSVPRTYSMISWSVSKCSLRLRPRKPVVPVIKIFIL